MLFQPIKIVCMLLLLCILALDAGAADTPPPQAAPLHLLNVRVVPLAEGAQLVVTLSDKPDYKIMLLDAPERLVLDLDQTALAPSLAYPDAKPFEKNEIIANLRYGLNGGGGVRLVVEARTAFKIAHTVLEPLHETIWQLIIDLTETDRQDFDEQMALTRQSWLSKPQTGQTSEGEVFIRNKQASSHPFTIVLDAGHGGIDNGAQGVSGILEKDITLSFVHSLRQAITQQNPDFAVYLTREEDVFLRLSERVKKARSLEADLFISIHADSIHLPDVRGATIYTISGKASDALAKAIAENENKADLLDGLPSDEAGEVVDILLDLARRETDASSIIFADQLIEHLNRAGVRLIKPAHRYAGFMVLRAPEIPSVLVELGYLSNHHDETLITDPLWRAGVATVMAQAIHEYAQEHISAKFE